jgi:hypothetical protein
MSGLFKSTLLFLAFSLFVVSFAYAQGIPGVGTPFSLSLEPQNPKPGETVSMTIESFSVDLDQSTVTWFVDGKIISSGKGVKAATVTAGGLGTEKNVEVEVDSERGQFTQTAAIRPTNLSIVWQAATYVPPFYKGKALESYGAAYKVVAIPEIVDGNGRRVNPKSLVYTWKKNDAIEKDQSGYGRDSFISTQTSFTREGDDIFVEVVSADGFSTSGGITIVPQTPEIHFYEKSPLYGVLYGNELTDRLNLIHEEVTVSAEPYYFSTKSKLSSVLQYAWTLNDSSISEFDSKDEITLRKVTGSTGSAEIGLTLTNTAKLLQGADRSLLIRYE